MTTEPRTMTGLVCIAVEAMGDIECQPLYCARFGEHEGWGDTEWEAIAALAENAEVAESEGDE